MVSDIVTVRIVQYAALFPVKCDGTTDGDFNSSVSTALGYAHTMHFVCVLHAQNASNYGPITHVHFYYTRETAAIRSAILRVYQIRRVNIP